PAVEKFGRDFLNLHGGKYGVGCANGTSAITVALRALGIGAGDEVLVPNNTFFGTLEPIVEVGAVPVLVDIDETHRQFDLKQAEKKITAKTKAMIPVHLYGLPEPMDQILAFAGAHKLKGVEDCAQAHLAKWNGKAVGTFGDLATFSFFPGKNLGAFGDAGFILTENEKLFHFVKRYIDHGRTDKYTHEFFGGNFRMDGMQGAVLSVKLTKMLEWTERRRALARAYDEALSPKGLRVLKPRPGAIPVYHLYVVEVANRGDVMSAFKAADIGYGVHYPMTMNQQPALASYGYKKGQFPVSENMSSRILSLPFFPEMTPEQMRRVVEVFLSVAEP
ncbi:MAG TPA: DegT/DnrJ/EryC1/StrS family aminotransferase, partial [Bdellovibrionales bacterium]|nr:DegT/DnrJ/EryC1/StrS family aminotransferase [Bdellovibrionales bacterium]